MPPSTVEPRGTPLVTLTQLFRHRAFKTAFVLAVIADKATCVVRLSQAVSLFTDTIYTLQKPLPSIPTHSRRELNLPSSCLKRHARSSYTAFATPSSLHPARRLTVKAAPSLECSPHCRSLNCQGALSSPCGIENLSRKVSLSSKLLRSHGV